MENLTVFDAEASMIQVTGNLVIKKFLKAMHGFKPKEKFESDPFMVGDTPMAIQVYPNGRDGEDEGHVSIYLKNQGDTEIKLLKYELVTDVETLASVSCQPVPAGKARGFAKFATHAECAAAYEEKDFVVTAKIEFHGQNIKIPKKEKFNVLENVYKKMHRTDFKLVFDGAEVPCHKIILAAASPVFEAMLEDNFKEGIDSRANMDLSCLGTRHSEEAGKAFVQFIYVGELQDDLMKEHASSLLAMGEMYDIQELKGHAEAELVSDLTKENMVQMISFAEQYR